LKDFWIGGVMDERILKARTKDFALRVIRLVEALPRKLSSDVLGKQMLRSATSVAANYRAACRARSQAEFVSKLSIVVEEADESLFWLELMAESGLVEASRLQDLMKEADELTAIFVVSRATARKNVRK
jgi:four helix bundle protein